MRKICRGALLVLFLLTLGWYGWQSWKKGTEAVELRRLSNQFVEAEARTQASEEIQEESPVKGFLTELTEKNPDVYGWLTVEGTSVCYPVMYREEEPDYYLHRAMDGKYSFSGLPFTESPGSPMLVHGHHMKNGTMFAPLEELKGREAEELPEVILDTLEGRKRYQMEAVVMTDTGDPFFRSREKANERLEELGLEAEGRDCLLLATCSYHKRQGRLLAVCLEQRESP